MSTDDNSPSPPTTPTLLRPTSFTAPPRPPPPTMGIPGQSAFQRYNPPAPAPTMTWPTSRSLFRPYRAPPPPPPPAAALVPVEIGSGSSSFHPLPPPMPFQMVSKRPRLEGVEGIGSGSESGGGDGNEVKCSVCGRGFRAEKALFGHMRSHPGRGWRGAHPPPAFRADEEFADIWDMAVAAGQMDRRQEDGGGDRGGDDDGLPDLNESPPPE